MSRGISPVWQPASPAVQQLPTAPLSQQKSLGQHSLLFTARDRRKRARAQNMQLPATSCCKDDGCSEQQVAAFKSGPIVHEATSNKVCVTAPHPEVLAKRALAARWMDSIVDTTGRRCELTCNSTSSSVVSFIRRNLRIDLEVDQLGKICVFHY